jgi:hypothetical protein
MGDILFFIKMLIYTFILVIILQIKVGPTTLEQKMYEVTHQSEVAGVLQNVAQGAAKFFGVQYKKISGQVKSKYFDQLSSSQRPGDRLKNKYQELKDSINKHWAEEEKEKAKEMLQEAGKDSNL